MKTHEIKGKPCENVRVTIGSKDVKTNPIELWGM
jgi:hypothetical protein